jgi:hypothetical protein
MGIFARKLVYFLPRVYGPGQTPVTVDVAKKCVAIFLSFSILRREVEVEQAERNVNRSRRERTRTEPEPGGNIVKKLTALFVGIAFIAGVAGATLAQTAPTTPPAEKKPAMADKKHSASGTVKTSAADNIVVAGKAKGKDAEWTFAVDPKTKIRKSGKDITAADLAPGDPVSVRYHEDSGKNVADMVMVHAKKSTAASKK